MSSIKINWRRLIVNRILITAVAIIAQAAWVVVSIFALAEYSQPMSILLRIISLVAVLFIIGKEDNSSYKIVWIILIMLLPFFGGILYIFAGNKKPSKHMNMQINNTKEKYLTLLEDSPAADELERRNKRVSGICSYVRSKSGYPVYSGTEVTYYPFGERMFEDMMKAIKKAEHFIFIEYFIIRPGVMWNSMLEVLVQKANEGVEIKIIYDDMGCVALLPPGYFKQLEKLSPNIKCIAFNPVVPFLSLVMNNRDHRKILVVDGHTGFNGGINLSDEYINVTSPYGTWKDTGVRLRGEAVINLTEMFMEMWHTFRDTDAKVDMEKYSSSLYGPEYHSDGFIQPFYDSPLDDETISANVYADIVNCAQDYVYIFTPYLILDDTMKNALCLAAKRGVDVRIVTPGIPDKKIIYRLTRANYKPLLKAGVRIYEYTPGFIHAKSFVSDDKIGVVGTINLDYRSLFLHFECGTLMYGSSAVESLKKDHITTMDQSREITLDNISDYYHGTMFDALLRVIAPLL